MLRLSFLRQFCTVRAREVLKPGAVIKLNGLPHKVVKITMGKRGKGGGFVKAKVKNIVTLNTFEKTFGSDELIDEAVLQKTKVQYSWLDGEELVFIANDTFEEIRITKELVHNWGLINEGEDYRVLKCEGKFIGVELPNLATCVVESIKLESKGNHPMTAILKTGYEIGVPEFVQVGDIIKVNSEDVEYYGR